MTAVDWLIDEAMKLVIQYMNRTLNEDTLDDVVYEIGTKAKQMEKEQERQKLIDLLNWMNKVAANNPMAFETDHDDIVDMYLNGYYK